MSSPTPHTDNSAEMLELIARVTASIAERMDAQEHALEEIRLLGHKANVQIVERVPHTLEDMKVMERELAAAHRASAVAGQEINMVNAGMELLRSQLRKTQLVLSDTDASYSHDRSVWRAWRRSAFFAIPIMVVLLALILPTFLTRHPLSCEAIGGSWQDQTNGYAACYFLSRSD